MSSLEDRTAQAAGLQARLARATHADTAAIRRDNAGFLDWAAREKLRSEMPMLSASHRLSRQQKTMALVLAAVFIASVALVPISTLTVINGLFVLYCCAGLALRGWMLASNLKPPPRKPARAAPENWPVVTILIPLYREAATLPHLVKALLGLDYPPDRLDIKILLEEDDPETKALAEKLCNAPCFDLVHVPDNLPRTKPKACNYGLWTALGEFTVIYDAEDRPESDQLKKAVMAFRAGDDRLACVQARLNYYNRRKNWLTQLFSMEYALLFDIVLPSLARIGAPIPLGGTSNFFRTRTLQDIGGWDGYNVTEDADLGLRLAAAGYHVGIINSTTFEEAVSAPGAWVRQRSRWLKGYFQTWLVHTRTNPHFTKPPLFSKAGLTRFVTLHLVMGGVLISAVVNPVFWVLYAVWLSGHGDWLAAIYPPPLLELSVFTLLGGNAFMAYLTLIAPLRRRWFDHCACVVLLPVYWLMLSAAGYKAVWQLIIKPFYWEKTTHGTGGEMSGTHEPTSGACAMPVTEKS
ncbi:glycosyltransferase family 2 protein [Aquisalinus flavus]|uniref:Glycosyltransferase 2-like domain-containing protein n=1 Tax=Aquisalinus flavus TaxID=1526572 RepID=A0A8J2V737_9PROT|nr:glycosyltransferase family 2 protein [Aquisalinus flavus]MBD0425723.1 glycosyltransferase [Aquisalinus flavus]UNE48667.1 glycosyltransferase [Aquisalinus flavus]GGD13779.1 hypothetical protein GCM10011342_23180 [Aquisalinus flavus]